MSCTEKGLLFELRRYNDTYSTYSLTPTVMLDPRPYSSYQLGFVMYILGCLERHGSRSEREDVLKEQGAA